MHKILQNHLLCAFVANLKIGAIYALYLESFCDKNLAIRKVFAFCDSALDAVRWAPFKSLQISPNIPKVETENGYVVKEASSGRQLLLAKEDSFW